VLVVSWARAGRAEKSSNGRKRSEAALVFIVNVSCKGDDSPKCKDDSRTQARSGNSLTNWRWLDASQSK